MLDVSVGPSSPKTKLFGRQRALHNILGGGKFADVVLWKDKRISGAILAGVTATWLLFEVAQYNLLTLLCHIAIAGMLLAFIWTNGAALLGWEPPKIPKEILSRDVYREVALAFYEELGLFLSFLHRIVRGEDLKLFLLTIVALWITSLVGSCCSTMNLIYIGFLGVQTLPYLYEKYEDQVDQLATQGGRNVQRLYETVDTELLSRIPRGPGIPKDKKLR